MSEILAVFVLGVVLGASVWWARWWGWGSWFWRRYKLANGYESGFREAEEAQARLVEAQAVLEESDEQLSRYIGLETELGQAKTLLNDRDSQLEELQARPDLTADLAAARAEATRMRGELGSASAQLERLKVVSADLAEANTRIAGLEGDLESAQARSAQLESALETTRGRVNELEPLAGQLADARQGLAEREQRIAELEARPDLTGELQQARAGKEAVEAELNRAKAEAAQLAPLQATLTDVTATLTQRDARIAELEARPDLSSALEEARERAAVLDGQLTSAQAELRDREQATARVASLESEVSESRRRVQELEPLAHNFDVAQARIAELEARPDLSGEIAAREERIRRLETRVRDAAAEDPVLAAKIEARDRRIADLESQLQRQVTLANAAQNQAPAPGMKIAGIAPPQPGVRDDLKEIKGIGAALEEVLNDYGITTFKQLADLDDDGIELVQGQLDAFPGRIRREEWVSQARSLHQKHHGGS